MARGALCNGGKYDNNEVIKQIVRLKHKRANLLGYKTHADFILERRMAEAIIYLKNKKREQNN